MKKSLLVGLLGLALTGCSTFKLGALAYCPWDKPCNFQSMPSVPVAAPQVVEVSAPEPHNMAGPKVPEGFKMPSSDVLPFSNRKVQ